MACCSWQVQCACTIARLSPCSLWPRSFSLNSVDVKMAGQQHLGLFLFLSGPFGAWFYEENGQREKMKCTSFPFGMYTKPTVDRGRPQCPVSYPDNNSASHLLTYYVQWALYCVQHYDICVSAGTRCSEYFVQLFEALRWLVSMLACVRLCVTSQLPRATLMTIIFLAQPHFAFLESEWRAWISSAKHF